MTKNTNNVTSHPSVMGAKKRPLVAAVQSVLTPHTIYLAKAEVSDGAKGGASGVTYSRNKITLIASSEPRPNPCYTTARNLASVGVKTLPVRFEWDVKNGKLGKKPNGGKVPHGHIDASTEDANHKKWWGAGDDGIGMVVDTWNGEPIIALDMDYKPRDGIDGRATLAALEEKFGKLPATWEQSTQSGGKHRVFRLKEEQAALLQNQYQSKGKEGEVLRGIDTRVNGKGWIVIAPSGWVGQGDEDPENAWIDESGARLRMPREYLFTSPDEKDEFKAFDPCGYRYIHTVTPAYLPDVWAELLIKETQGGASGAVLNTSQGKSLSSGASEDWEKEGYAGQHREGLEWLLAKIDPDCSREDWRTVLKVCASWAVHGGGTEDEASKIADQWSSGAMHGKEAAKYDGASFAKQWQDEWAYVEGGHVYQLGVLEKLRDRSDKEANGSWMHAASLRKRKLAVKSALVEKGVQKASTQHEKLMGALRELYAKPWNEVEHTVPPVDFNAPLNDEADFVHYSKSKHPKPLCTPANVAMLMGYYGCRVRYNEMRNMREYEGFGLDAGDHDGALDKVGNLAEQSGFTWKDTRIASSLSDWANGYRFNPAKDWIEGRPWDGKTRIEELADTVTVIEGQRDIWPIYLRRWLLGAINALYSKEGGASKHMLVLHGKQSEGKTTWFRKLAGDQPLFQEGALLDPNNKDSVMKTLSWWLVELGELEATYTTRRLAELKAFLTTRTDEWRDPYGRYQNLHTRRTAFVGTVNKDEPLADQTGNTRFATVTAEHVNYMHCVDMQQLWAEVLHIWRTGTAEEKRHWLSREEEQRMEQHNESYVANTALDYVEYAFDWSDKGKAEMQRAYEQRDESRFLPAAQVYQLLDSVGFKVTGQAQKNEVASALKRRGAIAYRRSDVRGYFLPPPQQNNHY